MCGRGWIWGRGSIRGVGWIRGRGSILGSGVQPQFEAQALWSAARMACRNIRTSWRSSFAMIRSPGGVIPTPATKQILRDTNKSLRDSRGIGRFIRREMRAGQAGASGEDGPFIPDVAAGQHGVLFAPPQRAQSTQRQKVA